MSDDELRKEADHLTCLLANGLLSDKDIHAALRRVRDAERQRCAAVCRTYADEQREWCEATAEVAEICAAAIERNDPLAESAAAAHAVAVATAFGKRGEG